MSTSCAAVLGVILLGGSASAATPEPITGTLSQPGYTVIALAETGPGRAQLAASGAFNLTPPATEVTLQLRAPNGTYAGPILLRERGNPVRAAKKSLRKTSRALRKAKVRVKKAARRARKAKKQRAKSRKRAVKKAKRALRRTRRALKKTRRRLKAARVRLRAVRRRARGFVAVVGLKAGARLGNVTIDSAAGYATAQLNTRKWSRWVDEGREATATNGIPIGVGNFGRVQVSELGDGAPGDLDRDGVPNALDIDDDGDLVVDNLDPTPTGAASSSASARVSQEGPQFASGDFVVSPLLEEGLFQAANANMPGLSDAEVEAALSTTGDLHISTFPVESSELDCGQLVYCIPGGTATVWDAVPPISPPWEWQHFPECCDPDGDGFGSLVPAPPESVAAAGGGYGMVRFRHGARSDQIRAGDVLIQRIRTGPENPEEALVATVQYVFITTPAPVSYDDGQGNSAAIPYPIVWGGPGTAQDPFPVKAGPNGHVVVRVVGWRPQRKPIPPETGNWIDMGGLNYDAYFFDQAQGPFGCDQSVYSTADPNLVPTTTLFGGGGFGDLAADQPASPADTFSFSLDMTACLASKGISFDVGEANSFELQASSPQAHSEDRAAVWIAFERVS